MEILNTFDINKIINNFEIFNNIKNTKKIYFGKNYEFSYFDLNNFAVDLNGLTNKDIFKFNMYLITSQIKPLFDQVQIQINYDSPCRNETLNKELEYCFTHDIYIQINKSNKYFDCAFDFVPKTFDINNDKYISSIVNLDYYKYFEEDIDSYDTFIENVVLRLLIILCSVNSDEYTLGEILFVKSNLNSKTFKKDSEIFRKIIYSKKENKFNLYEWFEEILPTDLESGEDLTYDEFIKNIKSEVGKIIFESDQTITYDLFEKIIIEINSNYSKKISYYKNIYRKAINTLFLSLKTINELIIEFNKTKKNIPQYINTFLLNYITQYNDKTVLKSVYNDLTILFDKNN
jgi:hypothetical protein